MKHLFKTLTCLTLALFIYSCQKDDTQIPEEEAQIESLKAIYLNSGEIPTHILNFVKTKTNANFSVSILKNKIELSNSDVNEFSRETPLGIVQTNKVVQVNNERNTKYTFKVTDPTNANSIINLVIVDMGSDIIEYFIQYIFDPNNLTPLLPSGAIDMTRFTGGITFYNMEGVIIGNYILNGGDLIDFDGEIDPCPEVEVVFDEEDNTNDNTNSNSGGGGTNNTDSGNNNYTDSGSSDGSTSGGGGELEDPDRPCGFTITYQRCKCGGSANGHGASECGCNTGSPTTITNTCTGGSVTYYNSRTIMGNSSPCEGGVGVLIDTEEIEAKKQEIADCLENSYDETWFNENLNFNDINLIHDFLITSNNCNESSTNAINTVIDAMTDDSDLELSEALFEVGIVIIDSDTAVKVNPAEELNCFNLTQEATLTVYVQQPWENSDAVIGPNSVGHAFIGIEQGGIVRQIGYYPDKDSADVEIGNDYEAAIKTNYNYLYHVSITQDISSGQLTDIVNYSIDFPSTYNTNNYACTDFAINIGNLGGMNLPSTETSSLLSNAFAGRSPGLLGQEIRAMNSSSTTTISTTSANSPESQGGCTD